MWIDDRTTLSQRNNLSKSSKLSKKNRFSLAIRDSGKRGQIIFDADLNCAVINRQRNSQRDEMKDYSCLPAGKFAFRRLLIFSLFFFFFSRNTLRADHYVRAHYRDVTLEYHAAATVHVRNRIARKKFRIMRIAICMRVIAAMHRRLLESFIPRRTLWRRNDEGRRGAGGEREEEGGRRTTV